MFQLYRETILRSHLRSFALPPASTMQFAPLRRIHNSSSCLRLQILHVILSVYFDMRVKASCVTSGAKMFPSICNWPPPFKMTYVYFWMRNFFSNCHLHLFICVFHLRLHCFMILQRHLTILVLTDPRLGADFCSVGKVSGGAGWREPREWRRLNHCRWIYDCGEDGVYGAQHNVSHPPSFSCYCFFVLLLDFCSLWSTSTFTFLFVPYNYFPPYLP